jgi:photosystem P840 reaction center iron-sulfur protein
MADPVQKPDISSPPAAKGQPAAPKASAPAAKGQPAAPKASPPAAKGQPAAPKASAPVAKQVKAKPAEIPLKQNGKLRMEPLNVNLGRSGLPQESAFPIKKAAAKPAPGAKPAPAPKPDAGAKLVPGAKPVAGAKPTPGAKPAVVAKSAPGAKPEAGAKPAAPAAKPVAPVAKAAPAAAQPVLKKTTPRAKSQYFIIENLCVGCGLCLDKCPPKVKAIGYKFYGDVQEGGFRAYIDQDACISCSACFSSDECPSGALVEVRPDGEVLDFTYTPPERLDFDLRFLHRFHREAR